MGPSPFKAFKARVRSAYARITINRVTTAFFIFNFVYCFAQGIIQSFLYTIDGEYNDLLFAITRTASIPDSYIPYLRGSPGHRNLHLQICYDIPWGLSDSPCTDIFQSTIDTRSDLSNADVQSIVPQNLKDGINITPNQVDSTPSGNITGATGVTLTYGTISVSLTDQCAQILVYPWKSMRNSKREDIAFVLLQFWLLATSVLAVMYDSIPHILAVLITRVLTTAWSIYAVWRTERNKHLFKEMISDPGTPCSLDIFPEYFSTRISYQISDSILTCTALIIACYLSWTLLRDYNTRSFKCVGAPEHINRINKLFMAVLACLQLEVFVLLGAMVLWIDILINTGIGRISEHSPAYYFLVISTTVLLVPWITMGWFAIRQERKILMASFLGVAFYIISGWSLMFYSKVYPWSFVQWPFLGCFTVASFILILATMILGVFCRLNFNKGLAQYLHAESVLASSNFAPEVFSHDEEKGETDLDLKITLEYFQPPQTYNGSAVPTSNQQHRQTINFVVEPPPPVYRSEPSTTYAVPYHVPF